MNDYPICIPRICISTVSPYNMEHVKFSLRSAALFTLVQQSGASVGRDWQSSIGKVPALFVGSDQSRCTADSTSAFAVEIKM